MIVILTNIIMGVVWIVFAILAYTQIGGLPEQAALFPRIIVYGIGISGILIIVDALIKIKKGTTTNESNLTKNALIYQILIPGSLLFITYSLLNVFGFYISAYFLVTTVFLYQTYRANDIKLNLKHFLKSLLVALIITSIMYIIFTLLLGLPVPRGSFF